MKHSSSIGESLTRAPSLSASTDSGNELAAAGATLQPPSLPRGWGTMVYSVLEPCWWLLWHRNQGRIHGRLPDEPCVLVCNHGSYLDWLLLHALVRRIFHRKVQFLAKEKVFNNLLFRALVRASESIVVDDANRMRSVLRASRIFLNVPAGPRPVVGVFPEGTRSQNGEPLPVWRGAAWLARQCSVPLVPVALCGFWEVWPPKRRIPSFQRQNLSVHFLEPTLIGNYPDDQSAVEAALQRVYATVKLQRAAVSPEGQGTP